MNTRIPPAALATRFRRKPLITALEPRLLLDGAAVATTVDMATDVDYQDQTADTSVHSSSAEDAVHFTEAAAPTGSEPVRREVAFVDTQVQGYQTLVDGMAEGVEVYLINGASNGLEQMLAHLQGQNGIDAIHVYSHGNVGEVTLGSLTLDGANLDQYSTLLMQLGETLSESGDLMLYGCYVGTDSQGQSFLNDLATLTGADVAASDDLTGSSASGANWELEVTSGTVETLAIGSANFSGMLAVPSITQLSNLVYLEDSGPVTLDSDITISGASDFRGGYIEYSLSGATSFDSLGINTSATPSTTLGAISVVGTTVYRGTGSGSEVIGSVDSTLNGQNGQPLRFNLSNAFQNGSFQTGTADDTVITGWTIVQGRIRLDGIYQIAGQNTPVDTTYPSGNTTGDFSTGGTFTQTAVLSNYDAQFGGDLAVEMDTGAASIDQKYGVIRGPAVYSNGTVALQSGDKISFNWKALSGGDAYDAYGYIINVNTGATITILDETGTNTNQETVWANREITIGSGQEGVYRFVFVAGSFDFSGGQYLGGKLMIDDVTVTQANPPGVLSGSDVSSLSRLVTYSNADPDFNNTTRTLTVTAKDGTGDPAGSSSSTITLVRANDAPSFTGGASLGAVNEDTTNPPGASVNSLFGSRFSDPDATNSPADTLAGIAVVADASSSGQGIWEYSTDGSNWYGIGSVSTSSALVLSSSTLVRFKPTADWSGTPGSLSVHAVDSSYASGFTSGTSRVTFDTTTDNATSAVSASAVSLSTSITSVNDTPVITNGADTTSFTETKGTLTANGTMTVTDVDLSDTVAVIVESVSTGGTFSGINPLSNTQLKAMLAVSATAANITALAADPSAGSTFDWTFTSGSSGNAAFTFLGQGETLILTYTIKATDSSGVTATASTTSTVTVTITGTNDVPLITVGAGDGITVGAGGEINDNGSVITASDTLTVTDGDLSNTVTATVQSLTVSGSGPAPRPLTDAQLKAMLTVTAGSIAADYNNTNNLTWSFNSGTADAFDFLATGETLVLTYTIRVEDSDSTAAFADQSVVITITGTNDAPQITVGAGDSASKDLSETNASLITSGTLTVVDADETNTVAMTIDSVTVGGTFSGNNPRSNADLLGMLSLNTPINANTGDTNNITWSFNSGSSSAFDFLAEGETLVLIYTIKAEDSDSATSNDTQTVTITITGTNDTPVISGGADTAALTETDTTLTTSGSMTVTDVDLTDTVAVTVDSVSTGGTFNGTNPLTNGQLKAMLTVSVTSPANIAALAADPSAGSTFDWIFKSGAAGDAAFNFLREGETLILTYTIKATDSSGASSTAASISTVTITITGTNESVSVSATPSAGYVEDVDAAAQTITESGTVSFEDVDLTDLIDITFASNNDIVWKKADDVTIPGPLGDALRAQLIAGFKVGAVDAPVPGNIPWTYDVTAANLDFLNVGDTITFSFTVTATDSSGSTDTDVVQFTITGTNDAPVADAVVIDQTWPFGKPFELDISQRFSDRDAAASGEDLDFTLTGLPAGLSYNADTGVISGIPTGIGKFTITMTATDRQGTSITREFLLEVLAPPQPPATVPVTDAPPPPSAPTLDPTPVTVDTTPLPTGTIQTGTSVDPVQEVGYLSPSEPIAEPAPGGGTSSNAGNTGTDSPPTQGDSNASDGTGVERVLIAEGNTRVSEVVSPDGRVTSVRASVQVQVGTDGQVVFNDVQKQAFSIVGLSVASISSGDNGLRVSIADAARGQDTQTYTGELGNGENLPAWISVDQTTGDITIGTPPPGIEDVTVRVKAVGSDGKMRILEIELRLADLLKRQTLQQLEQAPTESLQPTGFVPLAEQVAAAVATEDGYGDRLVALLTAE